jgi:signal transduction histidine kinase
MDNLQFTKQAPKILIVEDEQIISWHIHEILENEGYEISAIVPSGKEAIQSASLIKPDLVLMDIQLQGELNGFETADVIYGNFNIPVVYLTAYSDNVTLKKVFETNPFGYLLKPFHPKELHSAIQIALQRHQCESKANANLELLSERATVLAKEIAVSEIAVQSKTSFLAFMGHEFRNPLNAILGISQILQASSKLQPSDREDISIIYESGNHLLSLIEDILEISKIEGGRLDSASNTFSLHDFLRGISKIFQINAGQKGITFITQFADDLPEFVFASERCLRQVVLNLLGNAFKFTSQGNIKFVVSKNPLTTRQNDLKSILFTIEDTGMGIKTEDLKKIFLPFVQVGEIKKPQGTGLGLAISQNIVQLMGGEIKVKSQWGEGSIFSFEVDLAIPSDFAPTVNMPTILSHTNLAKDFPLRILLAEDNAVNQTVIKKLLQQLGYTINMVRNGQEALDRLHMQFYDVILMDIEMPVMGGIEATRKIMEEWEEGSRPYIIAMTANAMPGDRERYLAAGMNDYISKPFKLEILVKALQQAVSSRYQLNLAV